MPAAMGMTAKNLKIGMTIQHEGNLFRLMSVKHLTPGNLRALVQVKMRNVKTGIQTEQRFSSTADVERVYFESREVEYLYKDGESYHFMDTQSYEQFHLTTDILGDAILYLTPNLKLSVERFEENPIGIELPGTVKLKVTETDPFMKSATVTNSFKNAKTETGAIVQVPGFVTEGDYVEVDTTTGDYLGRVK